MTDIVQVKRTANYPQAERTLDESARHIRSNISRAIEALAEAGRELQRVQKQHSMSGDMLWQWASRHCGIGSRRTMYNYMRLAEHADKFGVRALGALSASVWYTLPLDDREAVQKAIQLAENGHAMTAQTARGFIELNQITDPDRAQAWEYMSQTSPRAFVECLRRKAIPDIDGHDIPVAQADPYLIRAYTHQYEYEMARVQHDDVQVRRDNAIRTHHTMYEPRYFNDGRKRGVEFDDETWQQILAAQERGAQIQVRVTIIDKSERTEEAEVGSAA